MIAISQLCMSFGERLLFYDVNLILNDQKRYALVGANGAGKSTFLNLLTHEEEPIEGTIAVPKNATIGWLKQDQFRYEDTVITDIVLQGKPLLWNAMQEKEKLLNSSEWTEEVAHRLSEQEDIIAHQNGYQALAFAEKLLLGFGIPLEYHQKTLSALSGGYKLRVLFAQALFQEPDILLLDEPTNHLDIISIRWLERYLKNECRGLVLFISHDVEFINRLADHILDVDYGEIREYAGNYEKFLAEKKLVEEQQLKIKTNIEKKVADMQRFVDKFKAGTRSKQAQSRAKLIEKVELPDIKQSSRVSPDFHFKPNRPSGKEVLTVKGLSKNYQDKKLFQNLHFTVRRGEKIAIIGENGVGKSTLIKILLGKISPDAGKYEWGYETHPSYFSQDHHDLINRHVDLLDWLITEIGNVSDQNARKALGQVLFKKEDVKKDILSLSGGEAARLLLARMALEPSNVLVLDEPTNHLDIEATDALAHALKTYEGTLLFVSHDRHFIRKIANRILFISHKEGLKDLTPAMFDVETWG